MKLVSVFFSLLYCSISIAGTFVLDRGHNQLKEVYKDGILEVSYNLSQIEYASDTEARPKHYTKKPGFAQIPFRSYLFEAKPGELKIETKQSGDHWKLAEKTFPAPKLPCRCLKEEKISFEWNEEGFRGRDHYELKYLGDFRGVPLTKVTVYPVRSVAGELFGQKEVNFKISGGKLVTELQNSNANKNYAVFADSKYFDVLTNWKSHRENDGFKVRFFDQRTLGHDFSSIQRSIKELYRNWKFDYALIIGSEDEFPTEFVVTSSDFETPSDMHYFTMGEGNDQIPDVYWGRLPVESPEELDQQVKKWLAFENRSFDKNGYLRAVGIASNEGSDPTDVEYVQAMLSPLQDNYGVVPDYFFQDDPKSIPTKINQSLNQGAVWLNYIGHGSGNSWSSIYRGEYHIDDLRDLNDHVVPPVVIDVACQNGRFNRDGRLGERMQNLNGIEMARGSVAFYGGSVDISWHPPAVMAVGINEKIVAENLNRLGPSLMAGQLHLIETYDDIVSSLENLVWYHLQGDPALKLPFNN